MEDLAPALDYLMKLLLCPALLEILPGFGNFYLATYLLAIGELHLKVRS